MKGTVNPNPMVCNNVTIPGLPNAIAACAKVNVPLLAVERPPWERTTGDNWSEHATIQAAIAALPDDEAPHVYLAQLLAAKGDDAGAAAERDAAAAAHPFHADIPVFVQSIFWVDPVNGGIKRR